MREEIEKSYGFLSCVGFAGEASFPSAFIPPRSARNFYCRKGLFATYCLMVCDNKKRIIMSFPDSGAISPLEVDLTSHFSDEEYLLADSVRIASINNIPMIEERRKSTGR